MGGGQVLSIMTSLQLRMKLHKDIPKVLVYFKHSNLHVRLL